MPNFMLDGEALIWFQNQVAQAAESIATQMVIDGDPICCGMLATSPEAQPNVAILIAIGPEAVGILQKRMDLVEPDDGAGWVQLDLPPETSGGK